MTTPAAPGPEPTPAPAPAPPRPPDPAPAPAPAPAPTPDGAAELRAALEAERAGRKELEAKIAQLTQASMSEQEKAVSKAREEGRAEANRAAALIMAGAEFRIAAQGRVANVEAALAYIDLAKLLDKDGQPDKKAIGALVDQLAAVPAPPPPPGHIPGGPRAPAPNGETDDWIRMIGQREKRR
jgi:hypothetical protein